MVRDWKAVHLVVIVLLFVKISQAVTFQGIRRQSFHFRRERVMVRD